MPASESVQRQKVALVTGGGQGIGREIAQVLGVHGFAVAVAGRTASTLDDTVGRLSASGIRSLAIVADTADESDCHSMVERCITELGGLDVLVNNAGIAGPTRNSVEMTRQEWQEVIDIDLTGPWLATRAAMGNFVAQGGGVVLNISSTAGRQGYPLRSPYSAAKWGLIGLTQTLAGEWGHVGVRVNCICPGAITGDRIERVVSARADSMGIPIDQVRKQFTATSPLSRMASESEVASAALFLCTDASSGMTGQTLNVDCGAVMR